jgi:hypothetical protein
MITCWCVVACCAAAWDARRSPPGLVVVIVWPPSWCMQLYHVLSAQLDLKGLIGLQACKAALQLRLPRRMCWVLCVLYLACVVWAPACTAPAQPSPDVRAYSVGCTMCMLLEQQQV